MFKIKVNERPWHKPARWPLASGAKVNQWVEHKTKKKKLLNEYTCVGPILWEKGLKAFKVSTHVICTAWHGPKLLILETKCPMITLLTLYQTIQTFNDPEKEDVWKYSGKRRKCWKPAFSPFPTMFSTLPKTIFNFSVTFILSSTNVFNLDHPKIMSFGKELHKPFIYNPPPTPFSKLTVFKRV